MRAALLLVACLGMSLSALTSASESGSGAKRSSKKLVTTLLNAKWASAPFVLEAAEFLAEENNQFFWEFIELLAEEENNLPGLSDKDVYDKLLSFSSR